MKIHEYLLIRLEMFKQFLSGTLNKKGDSSEKTTQQSMGSPSSANQSLAEGQYEEQDVSPNLEIRQDYYRHKSAHESGGFTCEDKRQIDKLRSVGKEMIKLIGRKILSGELNLTKISFPIRACAPKTALKNSIDYAVVFPYFLNQASLEKDALKRFKLTALAILSSAYYIDMFSKPLNPILGETLQAELKDGTKIYCEQISHHPPISYFLIYGPKECYQFSGYYDFQIRPGLNSLSLRNIGKRKFVFHDGTKITATYPLAEFSNTFLGTSRIEELEQCHIEDANNKIQLLVQYGKVKKKPSDYFNSVIKVKGEPVSKVNGTYCGFIDIDYRRQWDCRQHEPFELLMSENLLDSDWSHRSDIRLLKHDRIDEAQDEKERLEEIQRNDQRGRKKAHKH